jgi:signal peptidase II
MANPLWEISVNAGVRHGFLIAAITFGLDQLSKWWVLRVLNLDEREPIAVTSFFELAMAWNKGISYSLFATEMQWLLAGLMLVIAAVMVKWLWATTDVWQGRALGLIIGGAFGNALDRVLHGGVADFVHLFWRNFSWYIFNLADVAIVAGAAIMIYQSVTKSEA